MATYTAALSGLVERVGPTQSYSVNVRFDNPVQTFTFTRADGSTGAFTLTMKDVPGITPNFARHQRDRLRGFRNARRRARTGDDAAPRNRTRRSRRTLAPQRQGARRSG